MLARANRIVRPEDFRMIVRRGQRSSTPLAVYYRVERSPADPARFGFIVSRAVGGAVDRNRLRRRMRAVGREFIEAGVTGIDVVLRALPGSAQRDWASVAADMHQVLDPRVSTR